MEEMTEDGAEQTALLLKHIIQEGEAWEMKLSK